MASEVRQADLFAVPLLDGDAGLGQVIETQDDRALILLSKRRKDTRDALPVPLSDVISILTVPTAPFASGQWVIAGYDTIPATREIWNHDGLWQDRATVDPAVIEAFLNAWHGLFPWDGFPDPGFFDTLLVPGQTRPPRAVLGTPAP